MSIQQILESFSSKVAIIWIPICFSFGLSQFQHFFNQSFSVLVQDALYMKPIVPLKID